MAVGTYLSVALLTGDDLRLKVTFNIPTASSWGAAFTPDVSKAPTIDVSSPGYSGTTPGTINRTVDCSYISSSVNGSNQLETLWRPRKPLFNTDTINSFSIQQGAVTDASGDVTGAAVAQSIHSQ